MENNSFPMDKSEYASVFKVFDKDSTGVIEIGQVMELIKNLEDSAKTKEETKLSGSNNSNNGSKTNNAASNSGVNPAKSPGRKNKFG